MEGSGRFQISRFTFEEVNHRKAFSIAACVDVNFICSEISQVPWHDTAGFSVLVAF
jgi:hypothetical protein